MAKDCLNIFHIISLNQRVLTYTPRQAPFVASVFASRRTMANYDMLPNLSLCLKKKRIYVQKKAEQRILAFLMIYS